MKLGTEPSEGFVVVSDVWHHQGGTVDGGGLHRRGEGELFGTGGDAAAAKDAPTAVDLDGRTTDRADTGIDGSGRTEGIGLSLPVFLRAAPVVLSSRTIREDRDDTSEARTVTVGTSRVPGRHDAVTETTEDPDHQPATPAMEIPKLASMKTKSV
jgi:hypothetical protein